MEVIQVKKITGVLFLATAVLLLGSTVKPLADEMPRIGKVEQPVKSYADEMPRIGKVDAPVILFADEMPRIG